MREKELATMKEEMQASEERYRKMLPEGNWHPIAYFDRVVLNCSTLHRAQMLECEETRGQYAKLYGDMDCAASQSGISPRDLSNLTDSFLETRNPLQADELVRHFTNISLILRTAKGYTPKDLGVVL